MAVPFSNTKLRVPQGFHTLLESLTREILRKKPANIYDFAATYFENLSKDQKQGKLDDVLKQSLLDDRFYNNHSFKESYQVNNKSLDDAATKIQSSFRSHHTREELEKPKDTSKHDASKNDASKHDASKHDASKHDTSKQDASKHDASKHEQSKNDVSKHEQSKHEASKHEQSHREEPKQQKADVSHHSQHEGVLNGDIQSEADNHPGIELQRRAKESDEYAAHLQKEEDLNNAATRIQSTFRGFMTRKQLEGKETSNENNNNVQPDVGGSGTDNDQDEEAIKEAAATKIQATFRGFQTRRELSGKLDQK